MVGMHINIMINRRGIIKKQDYFRFLIKGLISWFIDYKAERKLFQ